MKKYYPVIFTAEEIGYSTIAIDLDGCISEGDTFDFAYQNIQKAIGLYLEDLLEYPASSNPVTIKNTLKPNQFLCVVEFDNIEYNKKYSSKAIKKTLTLPKWLNDEAEKAHINFSSVLREALEKKLDII